jgi:hypothetical protein
MLHNNPIGNLIPAQYPQPYLLCDLPGAWSLANRPIFAHDRFNDHHVVACSQYIGISDKPEEHWFLWPAKTHLAPSPTPPRLTHGQTQLHAHYRAYQQGQRFLDFQTTVYASCTPKHTLSIQAQTRPVNLEDTFFGYDKQIYKLYGALFYLMEPGTYNEFSISQEAKTRYIAATLLDHSPIMKASGQDKRDSYEQAIKTLQIHLETIDPSDVGKILFVRVLMASCRYRQGCLYMQDAPFGLTDGAHVYFQEAFELLDYYGFRRSIVGLAFKNELNAKIRQI